LPANPVATVVPPAKNGYQTVALPADPYGAIPLLPLAIVLLMIDRFAACCYTTMGLPTGSIVQH
jgi:hypothetical protein